MKSCIVFLTMMAFVFAANAADINGKWVAPVNGGMMGGKGERVFNFKVSGESLTGTIENWQVSSAVFQQKGKPDQPGTLKTQSGDPQQITEGKVSGDAVSFSIVMQMMGMEMKTLYKGKIAGDEIKFTAEAADAGGGGGGFGPPAGPQEMTAKRVAP